LRHDVWPDTVEEAPNIMVLSQMSIAADLMCNTG
jgi:hypothetical protein